MKLSNDWMHGLDPDQVKALHLLQSDHHAIIPMHDLDAKQELTLAWILQQVYDGKKVIITSRDVEFNTSLFQKINALDFAGICYMKNESQYRSSLQLAKKKTSDPLEIKNQSFGIITANKEFDEIANKFRTLQKPIFDRFAWIELADRLAAHRLSGRPNVLHLKLSPNDFEYSTEEYKELRGKISNYVKLSKIHHPYFEILSHLKISSFKQYSLQQIKEKLSTALESATSTGEELIRSGEQMLLGFIKYTRKELKNLLLNSHKDIQELQFQIDNYNHLLGPEFSHETSLSNFSARLKSNFDRSSKDLIKSRRLVKSRYLDVLGRLQKIGMYLSPDALDSVETLSIESIQSHLSNLTHSIQECERKMHKSVNEQIKRLNSKNISSDHPYRQILSDWENELDLWVGEMQSSDIFIQKVEINALSIEKKLAMASDHVRLLREVLRATEKLDDYIFWQSFQENLSEASQRVIHALEFEEQELWLDIFDQWYFHSLLEQNALHEIPDENIPLDHIQELSQTAQKLIIQYIKNVVQQERFQIFKAKKKNFLKISQAIRKKDSLAIQLNLEHLEIVERAELFPIQIVSSAQLSKETGIEVIHDDIRVLQVFNSSDAEIATTQAGTSRKTPCKVIASPDIAKRMIDASMSSRKLSFKLKQQYVEHIIHPQHWQNVSSNDKLHLYKKIASQFQPCIRDLQIYHTRHAQIFTFLGQKLNAWLLDELNTPYKLHDEGLKPTREFIVECLLDSKKPIVVLTRDGLLSMQEVDSLIWQRNIVESFTHLNIPVHESWSANWVENGAQEMRALVSWLKQQNQNQGVPSQA